MIVFLCKKLMLTTMILLITILDIGNNAVSSPKLHAISAALYDADNDMIIYAKSANESMANASTTKILTCILTLENADLDDRVIVSENAASQPRVKLGVKSGGEYRLEDLVYGMMLESYNDCAYAIAEHIGGSVENFSKMMNQKANEIGCYNTYFITPNGLDAEDDISYHHTTSNDLCKIMSYCTWESEQSDKFLEITQTKEYTYTAAGNTCVFTNHNKLLSETDCVISGKTGYTSKAGYCYVAAFEKNNRHMCISLLGCGWPNNKTYKWEDAMTLIDFSENTKETFSIINQKKDRKQKETEKMSKIKIIKENFLCIFILNAGKFY